MPDPNIAPDVGGGKGGASGMTPPGCIHPIILLAMVRGSIGKGCPFPTIKAAADHYGIHPEQMRMYVRELRPPEPKLLEAMGMERVVFYRVKECS
ncbi:hypothetical protein [Novosphingobium sp. SCN 63-17]|uniref:hypothetical protein n=1 Tax=Novosphingobium sp. SCN 63-17 TaxID=1660120 RepID=UPI0025E8514D|nr:hypothetical protein [Novosphingobium sp. SCN 63-17]